MLIRVFPDGYLEFAQTRVRCALGKGGVRVDKREGDGATPVGRYPMRRLFVRTDRLAVPVTGLPVTIIHEDDGWCDDPAHPDYNRPVKLPFAAGHEKMWREDGLYDLVVEIGHNDDPPVPGLGSAVFVHLAGGPDYPPTAGCVALARDDLIDLLKDCSEDAELEILAPA